MERGKQKDSGYNGEAEMTGHQCTGCGAHTQGSTAPPNLEQDGEEWEALM